jgi:imidazole glycerol-phosphate synthase subunit HisH
MVVVIDYGMGNLGSVLNMFRRIGVQAVRSSDTATIAKASKLILPGVGAFDRGMESIDKLGLRGVLDQKVIEEKVPVLGICLGMQLMCDTSEEGVAPGLGWMKADVIRFRFEPATDGTKPKVPHMGWNYVRVSKPHALTETLGEDARFYFVHSYHVVCADPADVLLVGHYGGMRFAAGMARDNVVGMQFHPEKSHRFGMTLLRSFLAWSPAAPAVSA